MRARRVRTYRYGELQQLVVVKLRKPIESRNKSPGYSSNRRISYFVVFVIVLRQCYHLCVRKNYCILFIYPHYYSGMEPGLGLRGVVLLLAACGVFGFCLYCLAGKGFLLLLLFLCVCRACLLLVRTKLFYLKFFKGLSCLFLLKLVD